MNVTDAAQFLAEFGSRFANDDVRGWAWGGEDSDFGKRVQWPVGEATVMEAIASVDLGETQLQLTITERDLATSSEGGDAQISFDALISFDEQTLTVDGEALAYTREAIIETIDQFNMRT
ncbi:hypothetical protein R70006_05006 [Paraburkholderia domus]|uniref:hypothetical protein n=1 Tax=Paraburkholderia domus TaxID=2793075 RepID=UPI001914CD34|nr:hypothetical protein [Paraburkholderia domus]MBK5051758.1 hypothetical protein [Burkholderia sp. R-70006]CAE6794498.1 hypothetical protein R70006_05006 [Paraburkholderia domus]